MAGPGMIPLGMYGAARPRGGVPGLPLLAFTDTASGNLSAPMSVTMNIGDAHADRHVVVAAAISGTTTFSRYISTVTIGGVAATADVNHVGNPGGGGIWRAVVPSGTTATVDLTFVGASANLVDLFAFASTGPVAVTAAAVLTNSGGEMTLTNTLDAVNGGHRVAFAAAIGGDVTIDPIGVSIATPRACSHATTTAPTAAVAAGITVATTGRFRLGAVTYEPA